MCAQHVCSGPGVESSSASLSPRALVPPPRPLYILLACWSARILISISPSLFAPLPANAARSLPSHCALAMAKSMRTHERLNAACTRVFLTQRQTRIQKSNCPATHGAQTDKPCGGFRRWGVGAWSAWLLVGRRGVGSWLLRVSTSPRSNQCRSTRWRLGVCGWTRC